MVNNKYRDTRTLTYIQVSWDPCKRIAHCRTDPIWVQSVVGRVKWCPVLTGYCEFKVYFILMRGSGITSIHINALISLLAKETTAGIKWKFSSPMLCFFCRILSHYHGLFNSTILDLYVAAYVGPQRFTYYSKHTTLMRGRINSKLFIFLIKFVFQSHPSYNRNSKLKWFRSWTSS